MRRNPDEDLRALERAAASGDDEAAARLDFESWRRGRPDTVTGWLVEHWLWFDANHSDGYFPGSQVLGNRLRGFQEDAVDAVAHLALEGMGLPAGEYYAWPSGEDGWVRGSRDGESAYDGPYARHFSLRDNRTYSRWLERMQQVGRALEAAGHRVWWVNDPQLERVRDAFVELDARPIRTAVTLKDRYEGLIREARQQQEEASEEFDTIEKRRPEIGDAETNRLQAERAAAGRLTRRERRIIDHLSPASPARKITPVQAVAIAVLMRSVELDPYAYNPPDRMEEIAGILGGRINAMDHLDGDPRYLYVDLDDLDRTTVFWDFDAQRFRLMRLGAVLRGHAGGELPNPPCWERLSERERVRLRTRSQRELGAIMRRPFPTRAIWSATGTPVVVHGLMRDTTTYQRLAPDSLRDANWLLVEWPSGERTVAPATGLEDESGRPWRAELPRHCRGYGAFEARQ